MPDPALPLHPMAPIIVPCACKGKLCGQPLKQRCRYVRLCFYQCYNTEMQEHVWNVIPSIIYIVWASSVIWVQINVFQNEVFLPAKPRSKAFISIADADCYPNLAYDAGGYPPCNNQLCVAGGTPRRAASRRVAPAPTGASPSTPHRLAPSHARCVPPPQPLQRLDEHVGCVLLCLRRLHDAALRRGRVVVWRHWAGAGLECELAQAGGCQCEPVRRRR
jgi:hypothetical protein